MTDQPGEPGDELDAPRLRWLIRDALRRFSGAGDNPAAGAATEGPANFIAWLATFMPLLFTSDLREAVRKNATKHRRAGEPPAAAWYRLFPLQAAMVALEDDRDALGRLVANIDHESAGVRALAYRSLAMVVDTLTFDDIELQRSVENCLREHHLDCADAAVILLAAPGSSVEKSRWAAAQIVRYGGLSRWAAEVLEAAAEGRPVPNTMLAPMTRIALGVMARLASAGGTLPFPGAEGTPDDWAQRDIVQLGGDLWPPLLFNRAAAHPLLRGSIDLEEREK